MSSPDASGGKSAGKPGRTPNASRCFLAMGGELAVRHRSPDASGIPPALALRYGAAAGMRLSSTQQSGVRSGKGEERPPAPSDNP